MAFAPNVHVFPGGTVDPSDGDIRVTAIRELFEETGVLLAEPLPTPGILTEVRRKLLAGAATLPALVRELGLSLRTDRLAPISRWVTPPSYPRRFDTAFFVAELSDDAEPVFDGGEIIGHRWLAPRVALDAMAAGELVLWTPTSTTLQQLAHVRSFAEVVGQLAPGRPVPPRVERITDEIVRIELGSAGAVPGQAANAWLVGRRELVIVDPGDPGEEAVGAIIAAAGEGTIRGIVLTHPDPDHAAGSDAVSERLEVPVFAGPGGGRWLPVTVRELADGSPVPVGDVEIRVLHAPGPRLEHVALLVDGRRIAIVGDLAGGRAARSILGRPDPDAWHASLRRLAELGPERLLPGHGPVLEDAGSAVRHAQAGLPGTWP
jgi:endoribonuclease LACTB2